MLENRKHYFSPSYMRPERFMAYIDQIRAVNAFADPRDQILEVGTGNGYMAQILRNYFNYPLTTLDINKELHPDILMDITGQDVQVVQTFDVVLCFEVLEHIPWVNLPTAIHNLTRHAKNYLILSVPDTNFFIQMKLNLLWLKLTPLNLTISIPRIFRNASTIGRGHEWEIGILNRRRRLTSKILISEILKNEQVVSHYRGREFPGHHFFVLKGRA